MVKVGGLAMVAVAAATATCGLFMLGGVGPTPAGAEVEGDPVPPVPESMPPARVEPESVVPDTTQPPPATTEPVTTPPATEPAPPSPIPLSVEPPSITVGAGGVAQISGECPMVDGVPLGPVVIWEVGEGVSVIQTGVTAAAWTYDWMAPATPGQLVLQVWCGDPSSYQGGYPESLQIDVVFVAQEPPTTTTTVVLSEPHHEIPETD